MSLIKKKYSLIVMMVDITFLELPEKRVLEISKHFIEFECSGYKIILFSRDGLKSLKALLVINTDYSYTMVNLNIEMLLTKYSKEINFKSTVITDTQEIKEKNEYNLLLSSKYNYFQVDNPKQFNKDFINTLERTTKLIKISEIKISENHFSNVKFDLDVGISIDYAIKIIKSISSKILNKPYKKVNNLWGNGYAISNYTYVDEKKIIQIVKDSFEEKDIEHEINKIYNNNTIVVEQYTLFKDVAQ